MTIPNLILKIHDSNFDKMIILQFLTTFFDRISLTTIFTIPNDIRPIMTILTVVWKTNWYYKHTAIKSWKAHWLGFNLRVISKLGTCLSDSAFESFDTKKQSHEGLSRAHFLLKVVLQSAEKIENVKFTTGYPSSLL